MIVTELAAKLGLEVDEQSFDRVTALLRGVQGGVLGIAAAFGGAVVGVAAAATTTALAGDEMARAAQSAGVTTDAIQEMAFAASRSNVEFTDMKEGLQDLSERMFDAGVRGAGEYTEAFNALGISVMDGTGKLKAADAVFLEMADKFAAMPDGTEKTAVTLKLLSDSGARLIPILNKGSAGIQAMRDRAHELGYVLDAETVAASTDFAVAQRDSTAALLGLRNAIGGPTIKSFANLLRSFTKFLTVNRKIIATPIVKTFNALAKVTVWLTENMHLLAIAAGLLAAVYVGKMLAALAALTAAEITWGTAAFIAGARAAAGAALAAAAGWAAAAPWALLAAAIFLAAEDLYQFFTGGESAIERWGLQWMHWTDRMGQEDGDDWAITAFFKWLWRVVFDIGDEMDRWTASFKDLVFSPFKAFEGAGTASRSIGMGGDGIGTRFRDPFAGMGGASSPSASAETSAPNMSSVTDNRSMTAEINVSLPPGSDPAAAGEVVQSSLDDWWSNQLSSSYAGAAE